MLQNRLSNFERVLIDALVQPSAFQLPLPSAVSSDPLDEKEEEEEGESEHPNLLELRGSARVYLAWLYLFDSSAVNEAKSRLLARLEENQHMSRTFSSSISAPNRPRGSVLQR